MLVQSTRFGEVEVSEEGILEFPYGIPGFLEEKTFALLPYQSDSPFSLLQSVNDPNLTFILIEPFSFFPDYQFEIDDEMVKELDLSEEQPPQRSNSFTISSSISN